MKSEKCLYRTNALFRTYKEESIRCYELSLWVDGIQKRWHVKSNGERYSGRLSELKIIVDKKYNDIRFDHDLVTCDDEELDLKDSSKLLNMEAHCNIVGD